MDAQCFCLSCVPIFLQTDLDKNKSGIDPDLDAQVEFGAFQKLGDPTTRRQVVWYKIDFLSFFDLT